MGLYFNAGLKFALGMASCMALTGHSSIARAESLFSMLYGNGGGERSAQQNELYQQGEDAPYLASQTLWESQRVRSLASTYGVEALLQDPTIKPGDVISTPKGLLVVVVSRDANGDRVGSLVPLAASPQRKNARLQALDKALREQAQRAASQQ